MVVHTMLLDHMCLFYEFERRDFLVRARAARGHPGARSSMCLEEGGTAALYVAKRADMMDIDDAYVEGGEDGSSGGGRDVDSGGKRSREGWVGNYMQQQEEERALQGLSQQYLDSLIQVQCSNLQVIGGSARCGLLPLAACRMPGRVLQTGLVADHCAICMKNQTRGAPLHCASIMRILHPLCIKDVYHGPPHCASMCPLLQIATLLTLDT